MSNKQLIIELNKMFCNYIQESDDIATFYEIALNYIENNVAKMSVAQMRKIAPLQ